MHLRPLLLLLGLLALQSPFVLLLVGFRDFHVDLDVAADVREERDVEERLGERLFLIGAGAADCATGVESCGVQGAQELVEASFGVQRRSIIAAQVVASSPLSVAMVACATLVAFSLDYALALNHYLLGVDVLLPALIFSCTSSS